MSAPEMPERIWLIPDIGWDGETAWSNDPAPEPGMDPDNATEYLRKDLCASGQQVRALVVDDLAQIIRVVDGNNTLGAGELAQAILEAMPVPRIVGALTPAPQPEGQDTLKFSPEYQALFDEVKQRAQPEGTTLRECPDCKGLGRWPFSYGGDTCERCSGTGNLAALTPAPTAQEAVPVGWITQPYPGATWSFSFHAPKALPEGWIARPLYANPPQPSETVAELLEEARSGLCAYTGGPDGACSETVKRIDAALTQPSVSVAEALVDALKDVTAALGKFVDTSKKHREPYETPLSAYDRATSILSALKGENDD